MTIRMYKGKLFEIADDADETAPTITGHVLDSHSGQRTGKAITVPSSEVTLTGNDQTMLDISKMTEGELLDFVIGNPTYLTDSYYRDFGNAIDARHAALRAPANAAHK